MLTPRLDARGRPGFTFVAAALLIADLLLLSFEPGLACGPGRMYSKRRSPRKLSALVFKQHVPNVPENTLGASGLSEGRITRDHPKFKQLVPNYNEDIVFKDEEGTGADRLMTRRLTEKVNALAISVMNTWPGLRLRVTEAFDEEGYHSRNSLHLEGRAVDVTTSDRDRSKLGTLARLAVEAGFDFVYYESRFHVHCSVKSESTDVSRSGGCFSGDSTVQTPHGRLKMSELRIGDRILVMRADGSFGFSEIILFLDRDANRTRQFNTIVTDGGAKITVTPSHLIFKSEKSRTFDISAGYVTFAKNIEIGDYLYVKRDFDSGGYITLERVTGVITSIERGFFAPLTEEGNVIVNDVVVSCYALLQDQKLAHLAFLPVRIMSNIEKAITDVLEIFAVTQLRNAASVNTAVLPVRFLSNMKQAVLHLFRNLKFVKIIPKSSQHQEGIHWYPKLLYKVMRQFLAE